MVLEHRRARQILAGTLLAVLAVTGPLVLHGIDPTLPLGLLVAFAGATALSIYLGIQLRAVRGALEQTEDVRQQALALAQCMKDLTRRMAALELRDRTEPSGDLLPDMEPAAPLLVTSDMAMPGPVAAEPPAGGLMFAPVMLAARSAARPLAPVTVSRIVSLPQRRLCGFDIVQTAFDPTPESHVGAVLDLAEHRLGLMEHEAGAIVVANLGVSLSEAPLALARLEQGLERMPAWRGRLLLGLTQACIRAGGGDQARLIGRLSARGIGFCLTEVTHLALDPIALRACGFRRVRIGAEVLLSALERGEAQVDRLSASLAAQGLTLASDGVVTARSIPELIDLGVAEISGPAVDGARSMPEPRPENAEAERRLAG